MSRTRVLLVVIVGATALGARADAQVPAAAPVDHFAALAPTVAIAAKTAQIAVSPATLV